jgi:RNA polymerase sigma-70 factor (sigma-E family)
MPSRRDREFEAFVREQHDALLRLAYLMTGEPDRAADLVQHALAGVYAAWPRIDDPARYVRRSLANGRTSLWRRRRHGEVPTGAPPDLPTPRDLVGEVDERDAMWRALGHLPPRQRSVLVLRYYEDRPDEEIARLLGTSESTVRSQAHRGLRALAAQLAARTPAPSSTLR